MRIALFLSWIALFTCPAGPLSAGGIADLTPAPATLAWAPVKHALPPTLRAEDTVSSAEAAEPLTAPATRPAATVLADMTPPTPNQALPEGLRPDTFEIQRDLTDASVPEASASTPPRVTDLTSPAPRPEMLAAADPDHTMQWVGLLSLVLLGVALVLVVILRVSSPQDKSGQ